MRRAQIWVSGSVCGPCKHSGEGAFGARQDPRLLLAIPGCRQRVLIRCKASLRNVPTLSIHPETARRLDLKAATLAESESPGLLPSTAVEGVLASSPLEVAHLIAAELASNSDRDLPEVLPVAKPTRGSRPVALLGPRDRVLYRALTDLLGPTAPEPDRSSGAFDAFKRAPLTDPGPEFVVMSDVASCYQYIDHELLAREVITRTGDPFLAESIGSFLRTQVALGFGLPQSRDPSHRLAELVLGIPERAMIRRGFDIWRYADDFRIGANSRSHAHQALDDLAEVMRSVGLSLNDEKSSVRTWQHYQEWVNALNDRMAEISEEARVDLGVFDYEGDLIEVDSAELIRETAIRLLHLWREHVFGGVGEYGPDAATTRLLLSIAVGVCTSLEDPNGLEFVTDLLDRAPALTPAVCGYLQATRRQHRTAVRSTIDETLNHADLYLSPWQSLWLAECVRSDFRLSAHQGRWLKRLAKAKSAYVRASALRAQAAHGAATGSELIQAFDTGAAADRFLLVEGLAAVGPTDGEVRSVLEEDPLYRMTFEYTQSALELF